jgi:hypothetical protein
MPPIPGGGAPIPGGEYAAIAAGSATIVPPSGLTSACGTPGEPMGLPMGGAAAGGAPMPIAGAGASCGAPIGIGAPAAGGATPSIVPLSFAFTAPTGAPPGAVGGAAPAGGPTGAGAAPPGAGGTPPGRGAAAGGAFIISMVPLNLGAAAPFRLKPHLEQLVAVSGFCVPQFGQNKCHLAVRYRAGDARQPTRPVSRFSSVTRHARGKTNPPSLARRPVPVRSPAV